VVHVDERCRIFVEDRTSPGQSFSKPHFSTDRDICHLEAVAHTKHWEYLPDDGVIRRTLVNVVEQQYVLHDPFPYTVDFMVDQSLPPGWRVDSDPPPAETNGNMITYHVVVKAGQTVRLHVGERR
jgi:hypothetical protein